jgi:hypothetical protein
MSTLDEWEQALRAELGADPGEEVQRTVLDLARVVAHAVDRPAAPLTGFYLGLAVGRGEPVQQTAARIEQLANGWPTPPEDNRKQRPA